MKPALLTLAALFSVSALLQAEEAAPKPDPLTTCVVSDEKLGEMGPPYVMVYEGQEVKFCCKMCKPDFEKNPAKYLKKIQDAEAPAK